MNQASPTSEMPFDRGRNAAAASSDHRPLTHPRRFERSSLVYASEEDVAFFGRRPQARRGAGQPPGRWAAGAQGASQAVELLPAPHGHF
jgi:hypothetical protein